MRVLAAMSGGVDSAVAAARAVDAGHDVTGVHLALSRSPDAQRSGARGCCTVEDARDARRAADVLGIPFYVWDLADRFETDVIEDFVAAYAAGATPNPCVRCNERIKFSAVLRRALALDFEAVVTGHHARLSADGVLRRSVDPAKDQSYVLGTLRPEQLRRAMFPLGDTTKDLVRAEAAARGLGVADKPDSHDICFVPSGDTGAWLRDRLGSRPGPIVDAATGETLGEHDGAFAFTVGQRRGLRLGRPAPDGRPRYVLDISPVTSTVTVGPAEALDVWRLTADAAVWPHEDGVDVDCAAQVRAHGDAVPAVVTARDGELLVHLREPVRGTAAGQAVILYDDDRVLGGGHILRTGSEPET
ncbi:tRNA 2-thiouridine(34) synthase MnmA [Pseudofrankia asymbiotica]|uniref:tRNA-specific 2-thiouridylase MnmA n=1 Tax=Pseudofrankia asymbiotica TaxID=1834516 RepID=A0A1V2IDI2_9ACTN|nr:tRNA 2-thiouridine(34) synthase MnmA [Pseudofrankia asymbiotica]ONH31177.1 tRNA 2-thiouridine(34) synthase MnmA [Pseudofrankia asymbiotica]